MYQVAWQAISCRLAAWRNGTMTRRVHSDFMDRMNRSTIAMLPCSPTAPNRGRIERLSHQSRVRCQARPRANSSRAHSSRNYPCSNGSVPNVIERPLACPRFMTWCQDPGESCRERLGIRPTDPLRHNGLRGFFRVETIQPGLKWCEIEPDTVRRTHTVRLRQPRKLGNLQGYRGGKSEAARRGSRPGERRRIRSRF